MIENGQVINGKYRLVRLLGDGGMGAVYEARHEGLGTKVAVKVLHADLARRPGLVERFLREARVSAQIRSTNVVQVTDVDRTVQGDAYIVMELLEGEPLSSLLERERRVPIPTACDYTKQILQALEAAHALGVVHRDLKPENVFITFLAGQPLLKLIDFGIAKAHLSEPGTKNLTVAGVVMGTAEYMAPEQAHSADKVNARSDLYAVGVMLYEMIAGERPVSGEDALIIALKVERGEARPLVHAAPEVPRELAGLVHRAMAARAELRFASATEMRLALEAASKAPPATAAVPQALQQLSQQGTGTVLGAPIFAPATPPAPPVLPARPAERTSPGGPPSGLVTPPYGAIAATPARPKRAPRRRWTLWVPLAFLVGVAAVVGVWAMNASEANDSGSARPPAVNPRTKPKPGPAPTDPTIDTASPSVDTAAPGSNTVAPLTTSPTVPQPHPRPRPSASTSGKPVQPSAPDAGANTSPFPGFPSSFPIPFPTAGGSGMGPVIPIPSLPFPIPGLPTAAPPAPSPDPAPSAAPTGAPRYQ